MNDTASAAPSEQDLFERVFPMPEGCMRCGDTYAPTEYSAWAVSAFIERFKGWQAARRAQPTPPAVVEPLEPVVSNVDGINERIQFRRGWRAAEADHGIGIKNGGRAQDEALIRQMVVALETAP